MQTFSILTWKISILNPVWFPPKPRVLYHTCYTPEEAIAVCLRKVKDELPKNQQPRAPKKWQVTIEIVPEVRMIEGSK